MRIIRVKEEKVEKFLKKIIILKKIWWGMWREEVCNGEVIWEKKGKEIEIDIEMEGGVWNIVEKEISKIKNVDKIIEESGDMGRRDIKWKIGNKEGKIWKKERKVKKLKLDESEFVGKSVVDIEKRIKIERNGRFIRIGEIRKNIGKMRIEGKKVIDKIEKEIGKEELVVVGVELEDDEDSVKRKKVDGGKNMRIKDIEERWREG